jgi:hypothetical protein
LSWTKYNIKGMNNDDLDEEPLDEPVDGGEVCITMKL